MIRRAQLLSDDRASVAMILWGLVLGVAATEGSSRPSAGFISASADTNWADVVEDATQCPHETQHGVTCTWEDGQRGRHFKFPAGTFTLSHSVYVPANTIIEGAANPNDANDPEKKPQEEEQTFFAGLQNLGVENGF